LQVFTEEIGTWWHPMYTANADTFSEVTVKPEVGGDVVEQHSDGATGPGVRSPSGSRRPNSPTPPIWGLEPDVEPSLVSAHFAPAANGGTVFDFAHGGWTESNAGTRGKFTEWRNTLDRFAAAADRIS
jgi:hypothetical protein